MRYLKTHTREKAKQTSCASGRSVKIRKDKAVNPQLKTVSRNKHTGIGINNNDSNIGKTEK